MACKLAPIIFKLFDETIIVDEFLFELAFRMDVNDHGKSVIENHFDRGVHHREIFRRDAIRLATMKHRLAI